MITIAIPFFNAETYLKASIESVIAQTYTDWKLLLVDDGSTDNSLKIANEYAQKDTRIKVFSDGQNKNLGYRLNQITTLVDTIYLGRMDADDLIHPEKIERQIKILENNPSIDVIGTNACVIDENDNVTCLRYKFDNPNALKKVNGFIHASIVAKTEWFKQNPYDVQAVRIEDIELWYRTFRKSNFVMLCAPLYFYRDLGNNYYKKYFLSNTCKKYILTKYKNDSHWARYFRLNIIKGYIYRLFNLFGLEQVLVNRRNEVVYKSPIRLNDYIKNI